MRKLLIAGVLLVAVMAACETKTPVGPTVGPPPTTTSTSTPTTSPTTSISTTTTTSIPVLTSVVRSFKAFPPAPPNLPQEMTLFFQLLQPAPAAAAADAPLLRADAALENEYKVTGVYVMSNGTTGTVTGELGGTVNPIEIGGTFEGTLTAKTTSGCAAEREFSGTLTPEGFQWVGGRPGTSTCSPSPLAFNGFSMLRSDPSAPLPTPPPTPPGTSTTTTSITCTYTLSPPSPLTVGPSEGVHSVTVTTQSGCEWSAQSFASWITMNPPFGGTGTAMVSFRVASTTVERTGTLRIAGQNYTVSQTGTPPDLLPGTIACSTGRAQTVTVTVRNQGGTAAPATTTQINFIGSEDPSDPADLSTGPLGPGASTTVTAAIPSDCYSGTTTQTCSFTVWADYVGQQAPTGAVAESDEANNVTKGSCSR